MIATALRGCASENDLKSQLAYPRITRAVDASEGRGTDVRVRSVEVRMVENVEELGPKLEFRVLGDCKVLENPHIPCKRSWPDQAAFAYRAESACCRQRKARGVEPIDARCAIVAGTRAARRSGLNATVLAQTGLGLIFACNDGKAVTALDCHDSAPLPVTQHASDELVPLRKPGE